MEPQEDVTTQDTKAAPLAVEGDPAEAQFLAKQRAQFADYSAATLAIYEAPYIVVDEEGRIEHRAFTKERAFELAEKRVQRVGGYHTVFCREAALRPPKAAVEVDAN